MLVSLCLFFRTWLYDGFDLVWFVSRKVHTCEDIRKESKEEELQADNEHRGRDERPDASGEEEDLKDAEDKDRDPHQCAGED